VESKDAGVEGQQRSVVPGLGAVGGKGRGGGGILLLLAGYARLRLLMVVVVCSAAADDEGAHAEAQLFLALGGGRRPVGYTRRGRHCRCRRRRCRVVV